MKHTGRSIRLWICLCFLPLTAKASLAQVANNTSLVGNITDAAGRAVVGVKVTAFSAAIDSAKTNEEGSYSISFLREGTHTLTVERSGFSKSVEQGILVENNRTVRTDLSLRAGSVAESMVVNAAGAPTRTIIDNRDIQLGAKIVF